MQKLSLREKVGLGVVGLAIGAVALTGCDKISEPFKDAPRSGTNGGSALIIEMPDGFNNLATKCIDGVRYTVTYHGNSAYGGVSTVLDPKC